MRAVTVVIRRILHFSNQHNSSPKTSPSSESTHWAASLSRSFTSLSLSLSSQSSTTGFLLLHRRRLLPHAQHRRRRLLPPATRRRLDGGSHVAPRRRVRRALSLLLGLPVGELLGAAVDLELWYRRQVGHDLERVAIPQRERRERGRLREARRHLLELLAPL